MGPGRPANRCLEHALGEYVDGTLPPAQKLAAERHLVVCTCCRQAVDTERRVLATLRARGPAVSADLHAMLLSLAGGDAPGGTGRAPQQRPAVPSVATGAPAQHRSAMRAAVCAGLAASASAAAAWSISVSGAGIVPSAPSPNSARPAQLRSSTPPPGASLTRGTTVLTSFTLSRPAAISPGVHATAGYSAQSTP